MANQTALEFRINGQLVDYDTLGIAKLGDLGSAVEPGQSQSMKYNDDYFVQQFYMKDGNDRRKSVGPMCVGTTAGTFTVKSSVPLLNRIFEPVVTVEVSGGLLHELVDDADSLCQRESNDDADRVTAVDVKDSLFSALELYRLCNICGMLNSDNDRDFDGCNPTPGEDDPEYRTGTEVCTSVNKLEEAQAAYQDFVTETQASIEEKSKDVVSKSEEKAKAEEDKTTAEQNKENTMLELDNLAIEEMDLHKTCDFVMKNFDIRQSARDEEIEGLKQAKAILSGAKFIQYLQLGGY